MSVYLFRRQVLIDELLRAVGEDQENCTFQIHEVLRRMIPRRLAYGWVYHGAWHYLRTVDEYYQFHRDLLGDKPAVDLEAWNVRSNFMARRSAPPPPVRHLPGAQVDNCLISAGCIIGGTVRNSVLSPGVRIDHGASVMDCVLWDDVVVGPGARLDRVISDKRAVFGAEAVVGEGEPVVSEEMPASLTCGVTLVGMDARIPDRARIGRGCILHPCVGEVDLPGPLASGAAVRRPTPAKGGPA